MRRNTAGTPVLPGLGEQGLPLEAMALTGGAVADPRQRLCSEVGRGLGGLLPSLASDGPAPLLPDGEAIAGADLLGVLEKASGACNDATGQPVEEHGVELSTRWAPPGLRTRHRQRAHLSPEFPVTLDKGCPPRPRSSSPSSTTRLRPITSHTFEERQQPQTLNLLGKVPAFSSTSPSAARPQS